MIRQDLKFYLSSVVNIAVVASSWRLVEYPAFGIALMVSIGAGVAAVLMNIILFPSLKSADGKGTKVGRVIVFSTNILVSLFGLLAAFIMIRYFIMIPLP